MSPERAAQNAQYVKQRRAYLTAHRRCETHNMVFPGEIVPFARDIHHTAGRTGSLLLDESKWYAVCGNCHSFVHTFIKRARDLGLIAPVGEWNKTARTNHLRREG